MIRKEFKWVTLFGIFLGLFAIFSKRVYFHDCLEYITIAKYFSGINNINLFSGHSLLYPYFISFFLRIDPAFYMIKLVNVLWVFLMGILFLFWIKNKNAFLIYIFSPLTWIVSIKTTPVLPASFFFFIGFILFHKKNLRYYKVVSGIFLGLSCAFYTPMILIVGLFILIYFWDKPLKEILEVLGGLFLGILPRFLMDFILFNNPFYSFIRYAGNNFMVALGLNSRTHSFHILAHPEAFLIFIAISPLLFKLYKLNWRRYKEVGIFLIVSWIIFLVRAALLKYFFIITPIIILLLVKVFDEKDIKIHMIISIFLIVLFTWHYFIPNYESIIQGDIKNIKKDFNNSLILGGPDESLKFATYSWTNKPYFVWWQDYNSGINNRTKIRGYDFWFKSKIPLKSRLKISADFYRFNPNKTYRDFIVVSEKKDWAQLNNLTKIKCYNLLCVYEK